ncbi:MAG TPA: carboxylating nicotinate-nucleotide diphosphorylase [Chitinophagales bacterium]|nr:carboxylating nicotinate-nucleotide diphosphorylase [Chitinophagales bacterium]HMV02297.1 carboxylating nicotinate-nucleotide diphosphorylase [Chitinophagales bacterium]HMY42859.1 carboxylating nicotinate-nucleotide diphosphorylase [Chitinophagales bacterium]HMZ68420.1 carboxylating nicotinate-nucleotide diphosphorylase [Chitinophagales bacterium]HNB38994.1 carboxylating nicotinate-nucleotide diphosphorylase [Chitinophagales bacterium]
MIQEQELHQFIEQALYEDIRNIGDLSSLSSIDRDTKGTAKLLVKDEGILCGMSVAKAIAQKVDDTLQFEELIKEGSTVKFGNIAFYLEGNAISILTAERLILNCMQRMSGIATTTQKYAKAIEGTNAKVIDTRKTTPNLRFLEKYAVTVGGGFNHRFGLYDMIMLKDNHIDFCGGITKAIQKVRKYLSDNNLSLKIEVETRNIDDVKEILACGGIDRIMLDNYKPEDCKMAVELINKQYEVEASGGITLETIRAYAETGVDFISVGALTHSVKSLDLSLKATFK